MVSDSKAKAENRTHPKRFYKVAAAENGRILLDGRELKTQGRKPLAIASPVLAEAVAAEWQAAQTHINPERMPLTRLVNISIDRAGADRDALIATMVDYAGTDLLCYRAPDIAQWQATLFDPVLQWAAGQGIMLQTTDGIMPIAQPQASLEAVAALLAPASDAEITALAMMVPLLGSTVLALAIWKRELSVEAAMQMARLDETKQAEHWGVDEDSEAAWAYKKADILASAFFLTHNALN